MSMYTLLRNNPCPSIADVENAFEGGYIYCVSICLKHIKQFKKICAILNKINITLFRKDSV